MLRFYLLIPILAVTSTNYWKCNPQNTVIPQLNETRSFPVTDQTLPYSKNMNCTWTINRIPESYVVRVDITANFAVSDRFSIVSSTGYRHDYNGATNDVPQLFTGSLYFPAGKLEINLISGNSNDNGFLSFTLQQQKSGINFNYPPTKITAKRQFVQIVDYIPPLIEYSYESSSEFVVRLVATEDSIFYASCFIYDDYKKTFLTGLDTQIEGVPRRFTGAILIYCYSRSVSTIKVLLASLPSSIHPQSKWTVRMDYNMNYTLTSNNNYPSYLTTTSLNSYDLLYSISSGNNNKNTTLELFCGSLAPTDTVDSRSMQFLEAIPLTESENYLPQRLCQSWNTYAVTGGSVRLGIRQSQFSNDFTTLKPGRKGFLATDYFGFQKASTATYVTFSVNSRPPKFTYYMNNRYMQMDSANVTVFGQTTTDTVLSGSFYTGQNYSAVGNRMEIRTIPPTTGSSYGALIFFEVSNTTKTTSQGCFLIALWLLFAFAK